MADTGLITGQNNTNIESLKESIKDAVEDEILMKVETIEIVETTYQVGDTIDDFANYLALGSL